MALNSRQVEGVIKLFSKAFISAANDNERKKILIDFEDTFGENIKDWKVLCKENIEKLSQETLVIEMFDKLANRKMDANADKEYEIRKFRKDDIPAVCEILNESLDMCITSLEEHKFAKFLDTEYSFVICENGSILGVILACLIPSVSMDAVYIDNFAIAEFVRGCGVGKKLFVHLCKKLKEEGIWLLRLQTQKTREAYEIYKHWGFEEVDMVQMKRYVIN